LVLGPAEVVRGKEGLNDCCAAVVEGPQLGSKELSAHAHYLSGKDKRRAVVCTGSKLNLLTNYWISLILGEGAIPVG
jgi:hypothetical protein